MLERDIESKQRGADAPQKGTNMKRAELIIIWDDGEREVYEYQTADEAEEAMDNMKIVFGEQISWCGVRERR